MRNDKVAILIKKTALIVDKFANQVLAPYELTNTQYKILKYLYRNPDCKIRQADIEEKFSMTNPTVTGIINNLEKKGLVIRKENPEDKRSKIIVLTEQAVLLKNELYEIGETIERKSIKNLTEAECEELAKLLRKMINTEV